MSKIDYTLLPGYVPPDRRKCWWCGKTLDPNVEYEDMPDDASGTNVVRRYHRKVRAVRIKGYGYSGDGLFCTLSCGYLFARREVKSRR